MRKFLLCLILLLLTACENSRVIVNNIEEREANQIVVFLASRGIDAQKIAAKTTGGGLESAVPMFNIAVGEKDMTEAMAILNQNGLPRAKGTNLLELFAKQGLMTTEKEESIRYQAGLEQQIANTIRKIDGVIEADVQLSFPEATSALGATTTPQQRPTAAVYVKHQGILDDPNSHLVSKIKRLVASSVNGLDINDVTVISDRSRFTDVTLGTSLEAASFQPKEYTSIWSIVVSKSSVAKFRLLFLLLIAISIALLGITVWLLWKCYPVIKQNGGFKNLFTPAPLTAEEKPETPAE
jgi:type III secretion protein J